MKKTKVPDKPICFWCGKPIHRGGSRFVGSTPFSGMGFLRFARWYKSQGNVWAHKSCAYQAFNKRSTGRLRAH